jgi:hypothetical protein
MSHRDVGGRRLDLQRALAATLAALPRLWAGAAGALVLLVGLGIASRLPIMAPGWMSAVAEAVIGLVGLIAVGALARLSISPDLKTARTLGLGPLGLQFRWPELRLLGAALLCLIFLAIIVSILGLVVLAIFGGAELDVPAIQARDWAAVGAPWKLVVLAIVGIGALVIPLLLIVRLSLFIPATLGRRQMVSLNSMGIAYGSFWALLGGLVLTSVPTVVLAALIGNGVLSGTVAAVSWVVGLVGLQLPLTLAFLGAAYRQLEYWSPEEPST